MTCEPLKIFIVFNLSLTSQQWCKAQLSEWQGELDTDASRSPGHTPCRGQKHPASAWATPASSAAFPCRPRPGWTTEEKRTSSGKAWIDAPVKQSPQMSMWLTKRISSRRRTTTSTAAGSALPEQAHSPWCWTLLSNACLPRPFSMLPSINPLNLSKASWGRCCLSWIYTQEFKCLPVLSGIYLQTWTEFVSQEITWHQAQIIMNFTIKQGSMFVFIHHCILINQANTAVWA